MKIINCCLCFTLFFVQFSEFFSGVCTFNAFFFYYNVFLQGLRTLFNKVRGLFIFIYKKPDLLWSQLIEFRNPLRRLARIRSYFSTKWRALDTQKKNVFYFNYLVFIYRCYYFIDRTTSSSSSVSLRTTRTWIIGSVANGFELGVFILRTNVRNFAIN